MTVNIFVRSSSDIIKDVFGALACRIICRLQNFTHTVISFIFIISSTFHFCCFYVVIRGKRGDDIHRQNFFSIAVRMRAVKQLLAPV